MRRTAAAALVFLAFLAACSGEGYKERFKREILGPRWASEDLKARTVCLECHGSEDVPEAMRDIPVKWRESWHYANGVSCHDCHGGDPRDAVMAMSKEKGFVGAPAMKDVPDFCGRCHIGIERSYMESGHGKALEKWGSGPSCVTCHGAHDIKKASLDIINRQTCTQCHGYERAEAMKQALVGTERIIRRAEASIAGLASRGVYTEPYEKTLFRTHAEFRSLFHTVDVELVKKRTEEFSGRLRDLEDRLASVSGDLAFRKRYSAALVLIFLSLGVVLVALHRTLR
ncbi:MAG: cytochrome c3 family protein [Thermodesulfovibrionales bacterium]